MALTKVTVIDKIEVLEMGHVQVRRAMYIEENSDRIAGPLFSRVAYEPGADIANEDAKVKAVASVVWTDAVVDAYKESRVKAEAKPK